MHQHKPAQIAQDEVMEHLRSISLEHIATLRASTCSEFEIFCAKLIRAMLSECKNIFILTPFVLIPTLLDLQELHQVLLKLDTKKDIIILDMYNNELHYKGEICHIIK